MRSHLSKTLVVAFAVLLGASAFAKAMADKPRSSRRTKELQEFKGVRYVPDANNDGDSFLVSVTERGSLHSVQLCQIAVQHYFLATDKQNGTLDFL